MFISLSFSSFDLLPYIFITLLHDEYNFIIGFSETVVILILAVMIFGADKLPEFARTFSKTIRQIKDASDGIKREIMNPIEDIKKR